MIQAEGDRIAQSAEPADRDKIVGQLESLARRWEGLLGRAAARQKQLEDILVLAKQFHETTEPVSDWLSVTEKKLANSEPIGTQTAKIQQQISRHKVGPVQEQDGGGWSQVPLQQLFPPQPEGVFGTNKDWRSYPGCFMYREGCKP